MPPSQSTFRRLRYATASLVLLARDVTRKSLLRSIRHGSLTNPVFRKQKGRLEAAFLLPPKRPISHGRDGRHPARTAYRFRAAAIITRNCTSAFEMVPPGSGVNCALWFRKKEFNCRGACIPCLRRSIKSPKNAAGDAHFSSEFSSPGHGVLPRAPQWRCPFRL
jgi:hypothetical protein